MTLTQRAFYSLFAIIIIEGYVVLSSELLAIRVTIPFLGSGTDIVSIIIAAVLLPLSFGYYFGGQFKPYKKKNGKVVTVRDKLSSNILIATSLLVFGLSYVPLIAFMDTIINHVVSNRLVVATIYSTLFLIIPVFLLGQTIPLASNYFRKEKLAQITGKILFFSTIGSFIGATFSTLVLMATIGVHYTAALNFILLAILFFILGKKKSLVAKGAMAALVLLGLAFNAGGTLSAYHVVNNNQYNVIRVYSKPDGDTNPANDTRVISLNHNQDSSYNPSTLEKHPYVNFIETQFIYSRDLEQEPLNILVIGAGGFTLGLGDDINNYTYVDIDPDLKDVAEKEFLQQKLEDNKKFEPISAESFLIKGKDKFDLIVIDAYQGDLTLPENLVTQDFFRQVKSRLADGGIVIGNFIMNQGFGSAFARNLDNTFRSVFPLVTRYPMGPFNGWSKTALNNTMYIYNNMPEENDLKTYTNNKNTVFYDKPKSRPADQQ
jgi:predicted membrane-bound spermidine synthase